MTPQPGPVLIVGAGLVGASVGLALTRAGEQVHLADRVRSHAVVAAGLGAGTFAPAPADTHLVVIATPPDSVATVIAAALASYPDAVVTDVASVKDRIHDELDRLGVDTARYVGSHPMAGSQVSGPLTASADLFLDRTWVITSAPENSADTVAAVRRLATVCGARVVEMSAHEHDRAVAQVSHLPHLMSILTAGHLRGVPSTHLQLAGQGIRDVTRVAGSDPVLWRQILSANRDAVRDELRGVQDDLAELLGVLDDPTALESFLARGRAGARSLPGKHGAKPRDYETVVIEIPDAPGALARLFRDVESAGVNVEDLAIEHDSARQVGYLSVDVDPRRAEHLRRVMRDNLWTLRP